MYTKEQLQAVLDCEMAPNDAGAVTVGDYLVALADVLWVNGEGVSGKRPFGNSGWQYDILRALAAAEIVPSDKTTYDDDDWVDYDLHSPYEAEMLVSEACRAARLVIS